MSTVRIGSVIGRLVSVLFVNNLALPQPSNSLFTTKMVEISLKLCNLWK